MRKLGQHFLINESVARREVEYAELKKDDTVLEVGPGKGILTRLLAEKVRKVIAVEIDKRLADYLRESLPENVEVICEDILKLDLSTLDFNKVVANLPFQISSPFTFKLLDQDFEKAVIIYQKEFAKRMVAKPGSRDYSRLSVAIYYRADCEIKEIVPKRFFKPIPKVDAAIVEIIPREPKFHVEDEDFFFFLLSVLFSQRRKLVSKVVKSYFGIDLPEEFRRRVGEMRPEEIGRLSNYILERVGKKFCESIE